LRRRGKLAFEKVNSALSSCRNSRWQSDFREYHLNSEGRPNVSAHNDAAFVRMFLFVLGALVAFTVLIVIAARFVGGSLEDAMAEDPMLQAKVRDRIAPVGQVRIAGQAEEAPAAIGGTSSAAPAVARSGAEVYQAACLACHATGAAGAPKTGDKAAWEARVAQGMDVLMASVVNGKGAMPPRGGNPSLTDEEIGKAIEHMLNETGLSAAGGAPAAAAAPAPEAPAEPVAAVEAAVAAEPAAPAEASGVDLARGQEVYQSACLACHVAGVAGAPKLGDTAAWAPRIAQGSEALLNSAINGKGAMPPKGGRVDLPDSDIAAAVAYMVKESQ
jgi:cytochrome c5